MNDYSTTISTTPVQVVPAAAALRNLVMLSAPGASNASGGRGDIIYSLTLTGASLVQGAPGTFLLQGGQTVQFGGGSSPVPGFVPHGAIWAVVANGGTTAAITAITNDYG